MKNFFITCLIIILKTIQSCKSNIYAQEQDILTRLNNLVGENINLIGKINTKNKTRQNLLNLMESNKKCYLKNDGKESSCSTLINLTNNEKTLDLFNLFEVPLNDEEILLNFNFLNLNKINLNIEKKSGKTDKKEENFLIIIFTNKNIRIINNQGKVLTTYALNFNINIEKADFSSFDEDNTVVILSDKLELSIFSIDVKLEGTVSSYEEIKTEVFIPTRKSINLNFNNDNVTFLKQHRLHGNKYIVLSFENGNILVMNKDLEMKNSILLQKKVHNLFLSNGFLAVISHNELIFLNVLGGNAVLLKCANYYNILHAEYDTANSFLFLIDDELNFRIYNIKLTISKQNSNECNPMFTVKLPKILNKNFKNKIDKNNVKMESVRNILYIIVGTEYVGVIDFNLINENGLLFNEYILVNTKFEQNAKSNPSDNLIYSFLTYPNLNFSSNFILLINSESYILLRLKNINSGKIIQNNLPNSILTSSTSSTSSNPNSNTKDSLINFIFNYPILKTMNNNIFSVYLVVIAVLSIIIIYYKNKKRKDEEATKSLKKSKFSEDDEKMLEEMMKSIGGGLGKEGKSGKSGKSESFDKNRESISMTKSKFDGVQNSKSNPLFDDLDDEEYEEYEEEEEIEEEEVKQPRE